MRDPIRLYSPRGASKQRASGLVHKAGADPAQISLRIRSGIELRTLQCQPCVPRPLSLMPSSACCRYRIRR